MYDLRIEIKAEKCSLYIGFYRTFYNSQKYPYVQCSKFCLGLNLLNYVLRQKHKFYHFRDDHKISMSQPDPDRTSTAEVSDPATSPVSHVTHGVSFSQPVHPDHMILNSQLQATQGSSQV